MHTPIRKYLKCNNIIGHNCLDMERVSYGQIEPVQFFFFLIKEKKKYINDNKLCVISIVKEDEENRVVS